MKDKSLQRAVRGDRDALREVVDQWWPQIRRWALHQCGDPAVADDAVQESLVRLIRFIGRYDTARPFGPWLKTLVRNACNDQLTKRQSRREDPPTGHEVAPTERPGRRLDLGRAAQLVIEQFQCLSPRQREVIDLVDLQGMTSSDAAERLGLSAEAVRSQLCDARRRVRAGLVRRTDILPLLREA